jgi:hypothetical protein
MKKKLTIIVLFLTFNIYSQDTYSLIKEYDNTIGGKVKNDNKLILISDSGCGHCLIALDRIKSFKNKLQIIIVDYGDYEKREEHKKKYINYIFLEGRKVKKISSPDFFPILYLYNKEDKLIWKKKGWFNKNIKKIKSLIK